MKDGMAWSHVWNPEHGGKAINNLLWDGGKSGVHTSTLSNFGWEPGDIIIQLSIGGQFEQEVHCKLVNP